MSEGPKQDPVRAAPRGRGVASSYVIHGVLVGGFALAMAGIGSQAARDSTQAGGLIYAALLQPIPMFFAGLVIGFGSRRAGLLAMCVPVALAALGVASPRVPEHFWGFFCYLQLWNLPGAIILAFANGGLFRRD